MRPNCRAAATPLPAPPPLPPPQIRFPAPAALQGNSKIERRSIPGFRDIIVSVFQCEDCGRRCAAPGGRAASDAQQSGRGQR